MIESSSSCGEVVDVRQHCDSLYSSPADVRARSLLDLYAQACRRGMNLLARGQAKRVGLSMLVVTDVPQGTS
jgi:hypothetical protein